MIMDQLTWRTDEAARRGLLEIEHRITGGLDFASYLAQLQCNGQAQCTTVWTKTTIAYRCKTCQVNDSSAICVSCFQAGDHRHHDYVMYKSDSGGCCDCGDHAAWKEEGFCRDHSRFQPRKELPIPLHLKDITCQAVQFVLKELSLWVEMIMEAKTLDRSPPSLEPEMAETYVIWLQKVCSVAALRTVLCEQIIFTPHDKDCLTQNSKCFLDSLLSTYARMPEPLMEAETTLFLQMLYDQRFKDIFSRALMRHYPSMILPAAVVPGLLSDYKALDQSLDRVMVQLFNVPETTLNLIQTDHLLECVTSVLGSVVRHCINTDAGTVNMNHPAIKEKIYGRPQGDLKLILVHESVALHVLKDRPDVFQTILSIWSMLQWMNPYIQSEPVDFEEEVSWTQAITLEMNVMAIAFGLISRCFSAFTASADSSRNGLLSAACLTMTSLREFLSKVKVLKGSPETVSLHIPLHRTFCAIISKLVMMPWEDSRDGFLGKLQPAFAKDEVLALMDHPLRVTVWMAQIRAQMWRNTSEDFSRLELIYRGSIWHAQSMDMDIFMLQFCSVALENMEQSVFLTIAQKFSLLELVTMPTDVGSSKWLLSPTNVSMIHDFLRLLLLIVRERRNTGMSEKESLRSDVIQWLCVRDQTYSQLAFRLSGILIDQSNLSSVLEEVAIYNDPKLQERGYYQLKPECWKEFDPLFAHFYLNDLEEAQERAFSVGRLPHYWRLQTPREAKLPFNRLIRLLHSQACHHLVWNVLHSVTILIRDEVTATSAEALGVMILQILGMALIDTREGVANLHTASQATQMESSSSHDSGGILTFIYSKPSSIQEPGSLDWDQEDLSCNYPSIYEMLSNLHQVKDSFRLVDLVSYVLRLLNPCSIPNSSFEPSSPQPLQAVDAGNDAEQRKLKKQRQDAILATFAARQKEFLENVSDDDPEKEPEGAKGDAVWPTAGASETPALAMLEDKMSVGKELPNRDLHECAFCRSECDSEESPTGWIALVQRFNLPGLCRSKGQALSTVNEVTRLVLDTQAEVPDMITVVAGSSKAEESASGSLDPHPTEHIRCCGHQMHQMCFQRYAESLIRRHYARSTYEGKGIIDLAKMEFLCPICRRLANVLVPDVNKAVPWMRLPVCGEENKAEVLFKGNVQCSEGLAFFKLDSLVPYGSSELYDAQYWKDYWHSHETLAESIGLFVSQCLRVRKTFLKGPPDFEVLSLCQVLWETFAENISHCEVETREGPSMKDVVASAGSSSSEDAFLWRGDAAHWRALLELGNLAMLTNTMPCTGKYQRRLQLLRWIGFEETIINRLKDDTVMKFSDGSHCDEAVAKSGCQQELHNQHEREKVHGVSESLKMEKSNQKDFEGGQACMAKDGSVENFGDHKEKQTDTFKISLADSKASGLRRLFRGQEQGDILEEEPSSVGWLWNESSSSDCKALASGDPFELLMMLLVTVEGCPTFEDIMTMVRVTYVLAATQASVAFDKLLRHDGDDVLPSGDCKDKVLELACLPFLRRVALLVQIVTERNVLGNKGGEEFASMDSSRLLQWMHLPNVQDAVNLGFQSNHGVNILQGWQNSQVAPTLFRTPRQILLTKLPEVFQELVLQNLNIPCGQCHRPPREPAICLVCGGLFCCGTECCTVDNMGECYRHADKESAGVGLYLLMRSTRLVILRSNRVCMAPSLYLDLHGEAITEFNELVSSLDLECNSRQNTALDLSNFTPYEWEDAYLKRGHPLHLSHLRLNEIRRLWLTAAFDHDTHILHTSQIGGKVL